MKRFLRLAAIAATMLCFLSAPAYGANLTWGLDQQPQAVPTASGLFPSPLMQYTASPPMVCDSSGCRPAGSTPAAIRGFYKTTDGGTVISGRYFPPETTTVQSTTRSTSGGTVCGPNGCTTTAAVAPVTYQVVSATSSYQASQGSSAGAVGRAQPIRGLFRGLFSRIRGGGCGCGCN